MKNILVVGAGFAGAVYGRTLADKGYNVRVIDRRSHIAGNCFDYEHDTGVRVHKYGPHLFHTSNEKVVDWLSNFTEWVPYHHCVVAKLEDGKLVPMPVNLDTLNLLYDKDLKTPEEVAEFLNSVAEKRDEINTAEDHLYSIIGPKLTNLFFRPYTKKMWDMDLSEMDAAVVKRLQIRTDKEPRYFPNDTFQSMPKDGYTAIFEKIFDHPNIQVDLNVEFTKDMLAQYDYCFNSMPIDVFFDNEFGELPYRSIRFHMSEHDTATAPEHVTINYTDTGPFTRETWWHNIPAHLEKATGKVIQTIEEPCDYRDNDFERYYPVKTHDGRFDQLYKKYKEKAEHLENISFIGRCGTYQYLDMHQVINQSLIGVEKWIESIA